MTSANLAFVFSLWLALACTAHAQLFDPNTASERDDRPAGSSSTTGADATATRQNGALHTTESLCPMIQSAAVDNGLPVDSKGQLSDIDVAGPFTGGIELSQRLADSADVRRCMTGQWYEYALGRDRDPSDTCKIDALDKSLADAGGNIREMLVALTKTDDFMFRRAP